MRWFLWNILLSLLSISTSSQPPNAPTSGSARVLQILIDEEVELGLVAFVDRALQTATEKKYDAFLLEVNTLGGRVDAALQIRDRLVEAKIPTIAFIHQRAISAGALISISCEKIFMAEGGTIGAATPIQAGGGNAKPVEAKYVSYFAGEMRATAERRGRNGEIAAGMVDPELVIPSIKQKGAPLTLTTQEALKHKFVDGQASTANEAVQKSGLFPNRGIEIVTLTENWAEQIARFLTSSAVSSLLVTAGILLLFVELKSPGVGWGGLGAALAFGLFFAGHMVTRLAGLEELLLFLLGVGLLVAELFVIPGFGVLGFAGIGCMLFAIILSGVAPNVPMDLSMPWLAASVQRLALSLLFAAVGILLLARFLPKSRFARWLTLETEITGTSQSEPPDLVGKAGKTITALRPAGRARIGDVPMDVVSAGEFVDAHIEVKVVEVSGNRVVVAPIKSEE